MLRINPSSTTCSVIVHPTENSCRLFEILQGKFAYVRGQALYSGLRSTSVFLRQIFIHLYKSALSSVTYDDVLSDWTLFEKSFSEKWAQGETDPSFRGSTFQSWASTMKLAVEKRLLNVIFQVVHTQMSLSYERFVDWVVTTGLVPIYRDKENSKLMKELEQLFHNSLIKEESRTERSLKGMTQGLLSELSVVVTALTSKYIPDYTEVIIEQRGSKFVGIYKNKRLDVLVLNRPIICGGDVIFDSPLQRLSCSIMACHRTQEHAKLCQLLNTSPIKGITSEAGNNLYSDLMAKLDESSQKSDPKKELLNLLVKLAENKTVSGVTDVVEDFITDVSQNLVDRSKLFNDPNSSETIKRGLKKHVSSSVFKCLTSQINKQFETIDDLQKERKLFMKKINILEDRLSGLGHTDPQQYNECIITGDTFNSLRCLEKGGELGRTFFQVAKGDHVNNSFFSQYIPPIADIRHELTLLWESEVFQTYKLTPVVDNQGQRLHVKYSQDTISLLIGPFTYGCAGLHTVNLITAPHSALSLQDIADEIFKASRLAVYILDIGKKYYPLLQNGTEETILWGLPPQPQQGMCQL